jgi:hypothetical protein
VRELVPVCPTCGARLNCFGRAGRKRKHNHIARRAIAIQILLDAREALAA